MIESLESFDRSIIIFFNGQHSSLLDQVMWFLSGPWLVFILLPFLYFIFQSYTKVQITWILLSIVLTIVLTDQLSVHAFKEVFQRYRPSHNLLIMDQLHFHRYTDGTFYQGGKYGFVSSHAANYFGVLTVIWQLISAKWVKYLLLTLVLLVLYSRMYLGVHYLSDLICGALLGYVLAIVVVHFLLLKKVKHT
jgi:undecaprenyl-diphosphatase